MKLKMQNLASGCYVMHCTYCWELQVLQHNGVAFAFLESDRAWVVNLVMAGRLPESIRAW